MRQNILEKTSDYIAESAEKASRGTSAAMDAVEEGIEMATRAARRGRRVAEEAVDEAALRIRRRPVEAVAATFALGLGAGLLVGWLARRR